MGTLTGDMLRLLAAGGINTAMGALGEAVTLPIREKAAGRQMLARQLIEGLGALPEEAMPVANQKLRELLGHKGMMPTYQAPTGNVIGPTGEVLAMTPVAGAPVIPETREKYLRPAISMDAALGSSTVQSPELREKILAIKAGGLTPKDMLDLQHKGTAFQNMVEDQRLRREEAHRSHVANEQLRQDSMAQNMGVRGEMLEIQRDLLSAQRDRISDAAAKAAYHIIESAHDKVLEQFKEAAKYGYKNMSGIQSAMDSYNELLASVQKQYPQVPEIAGTKSLYLGKDVEPGLIYGTREKPAIKRGSPATSTVPVASAKSAMATPSMTDPVTGKIYKDGDTITNAAGQTGTLRYRDNKWVVE